MGEPNLPPEWGVVKDPALREAINTWGQPQSLEQRTEAFVRAVLKPGTSQATIYSVKTKVLKIMERTLHSCERS